MPPKKKGDTTGIVGKPPGKTKKSREVEPGENTKKGKSAKISDNSSKTVENKRTYTTVKPPDEYQCIKVSLKKILNRQEDLAIIEDTVNRAHRITIKTYQLLKLHILNEYHNDHPLPKIDEDLIFLIQHAIIDSPDEDNDEEVEKKKKSGKQMIDDRKELVKQLASLYPFEVENGTNLKEILGYIGTEIVTSVENNIKENYLKYLKKYVHTHFFNVYELRLKNKTFKAKLLKDIKAIQKHLIDETAEYPSEYENWMRLFKRNLVPIFEDDNGFYYDIKANCQKYLWHMIWMNIDFEDYGVKMFQPLPLRNDLIPKSIKLCSYTLKYLYKNVREQIKKIFPKKLSRESNIEKEKPIIWGHLFNIKHTLKGYCFDYSIVTDGYSASLVFVHKDKKIKVDQEKANATKARAENKNLTKAEKEAKRKAKQKAYNEKRAAERKAAKENPVPDEEKKPIYTDFLYFNEVDKSELKGNKVFTDPGKKSIYSMIDENMNTLSYTNAQHTHGTKRFKYQEILQEYRKKRGITQIEEKLSGICSKTCYLENFKKYLDIKCETNKSLLPMYTDEIFRKYTWYSFINTKRTEDKMLDLIENKFGKDAIIILGDASLGSNMRGLVSTPNIKLNRKLKTRFKVYLIDEFRTSCLPYHTSDKEIKCENFTYEDKKVKPNLRKELKELLKKKEEERTKKEKERINSIFKFLRKYKDTVKLRKLHSVLTYKMENGRLGCINRDRNACLNMMKIYNHQIKHDARPQEFTRGYKLNKMESTEVPKKNFRLNTTLAQKVSVKCSK